MRIRILLLLSLLYIMEAKTQQPDPSIHNAIAHDFSVEGSLRLLNLWETAPQHRQELYRRVHQLLAADSLGATYHTVFADSLVQQLCRKNHLRLAGGPLLGEVTTDGVSVWVRTYRPAQIQVGVVTEDDVKWFDGSPSDKENDLRTVVRLSGLKPGTTYRYLVKVDNETVPTSSPNLFTTLPEAGKEVRIAFGTCFHRWGLGNMRLADQIVARAPHALILGGDIAAQDRRNSCGLHRADYLLRDLHPAWQKVASTTPVYTAWDDHDYFANDIAGIGRGYTEKDRAAVTRVWHNVWNNPAPATGKPDEGIYYAADLGAVEVIMLDTRSFRDAETDTYIGEAQMKWLKERLKNSKASFILLSSGTMWSDYVSNGKDSWGTFDREGREEIFRFIEEHRIPGVILISGDRHGARGFRIPRPSGYHFYEFEVASLGGRIGPKATDPAWTTQLFGFDRCYAFSEFVAGCTADGVPTLRFSLIDEQGTVLYRQTLLQQEVTPK